jgi:hypothetical protein
MGKPHLALGGDADRAGREKMGGRIGARSGARPGSATGAVAQDAHEIHVATNHEGAVRHVENYVS